MYKQFLYKSNHLFIIRGLIFYKTKSGHVDKVLITTCLGSRGLEKKIVVYISPESIGDFLAIVKVNKREYWRLLGHCHGKQGRVL